MLEKYLILLDSPDIAVEECSCRMLILLINYSTITFIKSVIKLIKIEH
jgi:hypothetical protein